MFRVRAADLADVPAIRDVYRRSSLSNESERDILLANPEYLVWNGDLAVTTCLVAEEDSHLIGFATMTGAGELDDLFVVPEAKRRGVATALIEQVVDQARAVGIDRIEVDANPQALAFYESAGFVEIGSVATEFGVGIRMVRVLSAKESR